MAEFEEFFDETILELLQNDDNENCAKAEESVDSRKAVVEKSSEPVIFQLF